jgi:hypothetical protein
MVRPLRWAPNRQSGDEDKRTRGTRELEAKVCIFAAKVFRARCDFFQPGINVVKHGWSPSSIMSHKVKIVQHVEASKIVQQ